MEEYLATLEKSKVFKGVGKSVLCEIAKAFTVVHYKKEEIVFEEGDEALFFFLVHKGLVKVYKTSLKGKQFIFSIAQRGDSLNACALSLGKHFVSAQCLTNTTLFKMPSKVFFDFLISYPLIALNIIVTLANRLNQEYERMMDMVSEDAKKRVLHALIMLSEKFGSVLPLTRQHLAEFAGVTPETAIRVLSKLKMEGIVEHMSYKRQIIIKSP